MSADKMESARKLAKKVSGAGRRKSKTPDAGGGSGAPGTAASVGLTEEERARADAATKIASRARVSSASKEVGALRDDHKQKSDAATKIAAIRKGKADRVKVLSMKNVNEGDESALASLQRKASEACAGLADAVSGALSKCGPCTAGMQQCLAFKKHLSESNLSHAFTKHSSQVLSPKLEAALKTLFDKMDIDKDGSVTKDEATKFFKSFSKINANAMFNEVDEDGNGSIAYDEWIEFWRNVMGTGTYETEDVMEELESMMEGGAWVDWNDGRTT